MMDRKGNFIQQNSPDGGFLQSNEWRKFQESIGRKVFNISSDNFVASIIEHDLPVVGKYFYIPRGPIISEQETMNSKQEIEELIKLAKENNINWIRFDFSFQGSTLETLKILKSPHDMQPREILVIDISKSKEELLSQMKPKTRYNIKLSQKRGVSVSEEKHIDEFIRLNKITAKRDRITIHPESYYRKMLEVIPEENIRLYVAEYGNKIIAANIISFYGDTATYLHGASDNEYRNVMAPYSLQWRQICDAKLSGCTRYDMGGVKTKISNFQFPISKQIPNSNKQILKKIHNTKYMIHTTNSWQGITKFKQGFSPGTKPTEFPGSYDIVLNSGKYNLYRFLQKIKSFL